MSAKIVVHWIARIWALGSAALLVPFAFSGGVPTAFEAAMLLFFPVGMLLGFAIAWRREALGGAVSVIGLAAMYALMHFRDGRWPTGPYFVLFAAPGFLFLLSAWLSSRRPRLDAKGA